MSLLFGSFRGQPICVTIFFFLLVMYVFWVQFLYRGSLLGEEIDQYLIFYKLFQCCYETREHHLDFRFAN